MFNNEEIKKIYDGLKSIMDAHPESRDYLTQLLNCADKTMIKI